MRAALREQALSNGYRLLAGRNVGRFETLVTYFRTALLGAAAILLCVGVGVGAGCIVRRSLLHRIRDINPATHEPADSPPADGWPLAFSRIQPTSPGTSERTTIAMITNVRCALTQGRFPNA